MGFGNTNVDQANGIATDSAGNVYITGDFKDVISLGNSTITSNGGSDFFIAKLDSNGIPVWVKSAGGGAMDVGSKIKVDRRGDVIVTVFFKSSSIDFDFETLTNSGNRDVFLVKYDLNGNTLWAKSFLGNAADEPMALEVDENDNIYVAGKFKSSTFQIEAVVLNTLGSDDIFVIKFNSEGNLQWANSDGGTSVDVAHALSVDALGNVFVTGTYRSSNFSFGANLLPNEGSFDAFVFKYDFNGVRQWHRVFGGNSIDEGTAITTDLFGNATFTCNFKSPSIILENDTLLNSGGYDFFIAQLDQNGDFLWIKSIYGQGGNDDFSVGIMNDNFGNSYLAGNFKSELLWIDGFFIPNYENFDAFFVGLQSDGDVFQVRNLAGDNVDEFRDLSLSSRGRLFFAGAFKSQTLLFPGGTIPNAGNFDIFAAKFNLQLRVQLEAIDVSFPGGNNGEINATTSGGSFPFQFAWSNGDTVDDISHLTSGVYLVTITDDLQCQIVDSIQIAEPADLCNDSLTVELTPTHVTCFGGNNAQISTSVGSGTAPFHYFWSNDQRSANVENLVAGTYSLTVSDSLGCFEIDSVRIEEPTPLQSALIENQISVHGANDGALEIVASGGVPPYSYVWSNGEFAERLSNLSMGVYSVTAYDSNGCGTSQSSIIYEPVEVNSCHAPWDWATRFGGSGNDNVNAIATDAEGNVYVAGEHHSEPSFKIGPFSLEIFYG